MKSGKKQLIPIIRAILWPFRNPNMVTSNTGKKLFRSCAFHKAGVQPRPATVHYMDWLIPPLAPELTSAMFSVRISSPDSTAPDAEAVCMAALRMVAVTVPKAINWFKITLLSFTSSLALMASFAWRSQVEMFKGSKAGP